MLLAKSEQVSIIVETCFLLNVVGPPGLEPGTY